MSDAQARSEATLHIGGGKLADGPLSLAFRPLGGGQRRFHRAKHYSPKELSRSSRIHGSCLTHARQYNHALIIAILQFKEKKHGPDRSEVRRLLGRDA